jgi:hypothetical protein
MRRPTGQSLLRGRSNSSRPLLIAFVKVSLEVKEFTSHCYVWFGCDSYFRQLLAH